MALKTSGQALIAIALFCATIIFVVVKTNNQNAVLLERIAKLESGSGANPKIAAPVAAKSNLASTPGLGAPLKKCILDAKTDMWDDFVSIVRTCVKEHNAPLRDMATTFEAFHMGRYEEKKYFIPLADPSASCNWLTIGVGGDSQVEQEFKHKYPQCNVFGIEPSDDQKSDFEKYGTIIPHAVGTSSGTATIRARVGTSYVFKDVPIVPLHTTVEDNLKTLIVDYSTLDIEGFEYPLLKGMLDGGVFKETGLTFCQMDVEFHTPEMSNKFADKISATSEFGAYFRKFLEETDFVPVLAETFLSHRKATLVNPIHPHCVEQFALGKYLHA